jgi:PLP dependent protein
VRAPGLYMIESVDSVKLAEKLEKEMNKWEREPLKVLVQVSTGDEDSKHGVKIEEATSLVCFIRDSCPRLQFSGLMAMGKLNDRDGFV